MCFSLGWLQQLFVWIIIICAIIAIIKILLPYVMSFAGELGGAAAVIIAVVKIVFWAIVAIMVVYVVFALISCLLGMGGGLPSLRLH